jgi:hypothetical protein
LALAVTLLACPAYAEDLNPVSEPSGHAMLLDLLILRPVGLVATAVGGIGYVVSLPFSAAGGNAEQARRTLVEDPAYYTFGRPLGDTNPADDPLR